MDILLDILVAIIVLAAGFSLLTYAFAWYEAANAEPTLMKDRFSPNRLALALRLVVGEALVLLVTIAVHPLGWFNLPATRGDRAVQHDRDVPLVLLHGLFQSPACWLWLRFRLRRAGWSQVHTVRLPPWQDIEILTAKVARTVDRLRLKHQVDKVHLVGHSMGGLIARNYLQIASGDGKVDRCILLGTPHHGSRLAPFALSPLGLNAAPSSDFLKRLAETPLPSTANITAIHTRHENIVLPWQSARLDGVANVELAGMGHTSLLFHPRAVALVLATLQEEKDDRHPAP